MAVKESKSGRTRRELEHALENARNQMRRHKHEAEGWEEEIAGLEDKLEDLAEDVAKYVRGKDSPDA